MSIEFDRPVGVDTPEAVAEWTYQQLVRIEQYLNDGPKVIRLATSYAAPEKTFDGMIVFADGVEWDPGSGEGVYVFYNSVWNYANYFEAP